MVKANRSTFLVSRTFIFDAAHYLEGYQGKCSQLHGHRYELTITYQCPQGDDGLAFDFTELKDLVDRHVIADLDHQDLNSVNGMDNPTAENICLWVMNRLLALIDQQWLYAVSLKEGRDTQVTLLRQYLNYAGGMNDFTDQRLRHA